MNSDSENNFRDFFMNNIDFLFILDMEGNVIETNNAVNTVLGYSNEELEGKNVISVHPPEYREEAQEIVGAMLRGEKNSCPIPLITRDGDYIPVETRIFRGSWNSREVLIGVSRNLTDLKLSEEKFFNIFNLSSVLKAIIKLDNRIVIDANKQFLSKLGYSRDEVIGKVVTDLGFVTDKKQMAAISETFRRDRCIHNMEVTFNTRDGKQLSCLLSIDLIKIQVQNYLLASATDITGQKEAEDKIQYLFRQQKLLADISQLLNSVINLKSVLNDVLRIIGEHIGSSRVYIFEDYNGGAYTRNTYEWCSPGIPPQIDLLQEVPYSLAPSWKESLMSKGSVHASDIRELPDEVYNFLSPLGIRSILAFPLFVQDSYFGFIGFDEVNAAKRWDPDEYNLLMTISNIISNAYDRKVALEKLENSELRLKLAISSAKEGLWDWNNKTGHVYFNDMWCRMLGYEPDEIEPRIESWEKLVHPDDVPYVIEELSKNFAGHTEYYETVHRMCTKDGGWKWMLGHGMVVQRDEEYRPVRTLGTHIDITKQKETEYQLQELVNTRNKLFSIIAHDLRSPISSFIPILELLTDEERINQTEQKEFLEELKNAAKKTLGLLENLLNWSRSQTNTIVLNPAQFNINSLIRETIELYSSSASQKGQSVSFSPTADNSVVADRETVSLVLRNLLSNAIKYTPQGGEIVISVSPQEKNTEIIVKDNGVGMNEETLKGLFIPSNFLSTPGTNREKGSGIGLMLCRDFAEKNGGTIRAESSQGKGSRFIFTLPSGKNMPHNTHARN